MRFITVLTVKGGMVMADREKYVEILSEITEAAKKFNEDVPIRISLICVKDILELLKEQEPALPTWSQGKAYCGKCGHRLPRKGADMEINYCGYCGWAVKWNE